MKLVLLIIGIVALSVALLSVKVILGGKFGAKHIGQSREMRRRGIHCVQSMDAMERKGRRDLSIPRRKEHGK